MHNNKILLLFICIPPLSILYFIARYSVNIPYMDQWDGMIELLSAMKDGSLSFSHLWTQHNEHRLFFPKLIMISLASISHWNVVWEQYFSIFIQCCTLILILDISNKTLPSRGNSQSHLFKIVISILLFSMVQYENWCWGWQLQIFLNLFSVSFAVWAVARWGAGRRGLFFALTGSVIATYSFANGMLIWIVIFLILLLLKPSKASLPVVWLIIFLIMLTLYLFNYEKPGYHSGLTSLMDNPLNFITFILCYIGSPFGRWLGLWASFFFGILGTSAFIFLFVCLFKSNRENFEKSLPWAGIIIYVLLTAIMTGIGRSGFGAEQALFSRYTTFSLLFWIALYAILLQNHLLLRRYKIIISARLSSLIFTLLTALFTFSYLASYIHGSFSFIAHFSNMTRVHYLLGYRHHFGIGKEFEALFPSIEELNAAINKLRLLKMGPFYKEIPDPEGFYIQGSFIARTSSDLFHAYYKDDFLVLEKNGVILFNIEITDPGNYQLSAEIESGCDHGTIIFMIDGTEAGKPYRWTADSKNSDTQSVSIKYKKIFLSKGLHKITIKGHNGTSVIRAIALNMAE